MKVFSRDFSKSTLSSLSPWYSSIFLAISTTSYSNVTPLGVGRSLLCTAGRSTHHESPFLILGDPRSGAKGPDPADTRPPKVLEEGMSLRYLLFPIIPRAAGSFPFIKVIISPTQNSIIYALSGRIAITVYALIHPGHIFV